MQAEIVYPEQETGTVVSYLITDQYGYSTALAPGVEDWERALFPRWTPVVYKQPGYRATRTGEVVRLRHMIRYPRIPGGEPHRVLQAMVRWTERGPSKRYGSGLTSWVDVDHLEVRDGDAATTTGDAI